MRVNPINYNYSYPLKKMQTGENTHFSSPASDTFVSFTGSVRNRSPHGLNCLNVSDHKNIVDIIKASDDFRLDGSVQGLYQYNNFMVKSPDSMKYDTSLKEYYALQRLKQPKGAPQITPIPTAISKMGERHYLVEEYVQGKHAADLPFRLKDVDEIMGKLFVMDRQGIINHDLSPRNIIITPDKTSRIIDFDTFSLLSEDGKILHSSSTPGAYFASRLPKVSLTSTEFASAAGTSAKTFKNVPVEEMYARSFTYERKIPSGLQDLVHIRNMADNPYLGVPSNLTNYEANTIYRRIMECDVDNPVQFLINYSRKKAGYHEKMGEFLKGVRIPLDATEHGAGRLNLAQAEERLRQAVEYEGFLTKMYTEHSDEYMAKLEAAKMQLGALMGGENLDKYIDNKAQLHSAYEKLIKVIEDGIESYEDPDWQKYLKAELGRYTEAFSNTNFSITRARQGVAGSLDILGVWFGDGAYDKGSFTAVKEEIKRDIVQAIKVQIKKQGTETVIETAADGTTKTTRGVIEDMVSKKLEITKGRIPERQRGAAIKIITDEIMESGFQENPVEVMRRGSAISFGENINTRVKETARKAEDAVKTTVRTLEGVTPAEEAIGEYVKQYQKQKYIKNGGKLFMAGAAIIAACGLIAYTVSTFKKQKNENNPVVQNLNAPAAQNALLKPSDSVFKEFTA